MLARDKFPVEKLPIEAFIANRLVWRKKMEKAGKELNFVLRDKETKQREI